MRTIKDNFNTFEVICFILISLISAEHDANFMSSAAKTSALSL